MPLSVPHSDGTEQCLRSSLSACMLKESRGSLCFDTIPAPFVRLARCHSRLCSFILLFSSLPLQETKLAPPENEFIASLNLPAEKASGWGTKTSSIRWKVCAQPNINTVKNIGMFFSDLLPLELLRMKGQVHPWCKAICFGFCWEWIWRSGSTVPVARQWVQEEGNRLHPGTGTNQRLLHTQKWHNTQGRQQRSVTRITAPWVPHHNTPPGAPGFSRAMWCYNQEVLICKELWLPVHIHMTHLVFKISQIHFVSGCLHTQLAWFTASMMYL